MNNPDYTPPPPQPGYTPPPLQPDYTPPPPPSDFRRDLWRGLGWTLALHSLQLPFALYSKGVTLLFIGFSQVLYLSPAFIAAMLLRRYGIAVGLLIGGALTLLLSFAVCAGVIVFQPRF
jgi:hypothetical protein